MTGQEESIVGALVRLNDLGRKARVDEMADLEGEVVSVETFQMTVGGKQVSRNLWVRVDWGLDDKGQERIWLEIPAYLEIAA